MNAAILSHKETIMLSPEVRSLLYRYQLMPQVWRGMVIDRAIAALTCTEVEKENAIAQFLTQHQLTSEVERDTWLQHHQLTLAEMEEMAIRPVLIEKFKFANWDNKIESYFLQKKADLDRVIYSLIRTKEGWLAQELYFQIAEGEQSFADLAKVYSQGTEAHTRGVLGPVPLSQPHPAIRQILSVSRPGQLWQPLIVADWFAIVRLEKLIPAKLDATMRQYLLNELFENWLQEQIRWHFQPLELLS